MERTPWCDGNMSRETSLIADKLSQVRAIIFLQLNQHFFTLPSILLLRLSFQYFPRQVNKLGVLTINSQPSAHCVPRLIPSDKILGLTPFVQFGHKLDTGLKTLFVAATTKCLAGAIPEAMSSKKLTSSSSQGVTWMLFIQKVFTSTFFQRRERVGSPPSFGSVAWS